MRASQRLIIEAVYASWAVQDLEPIRACVHPDAVYRQHLPPGAWPICGVVRGKREIIASLAHFLRDFDVIEYRPLKITCFDDISVSRVKIHYGHKPTGLSYETTARKIARVEGDKIRSFEVIHDSARLRAFYEMVSRIGVDA